MQHLQVLVPVTDNPTCIGIGGDPINGTSHLDAVKMFRSIEDPDTEAIILEKEEPKWCAFGNK